MKTLFLAKILLLAVLLGACSSNPIKVRKATNGLNLEQGRGLIVTRIRTFVVDASGDKTPSLVKLTTYKPDHPLDMHIDQTASRIVNREDGYHVLSAQEGFYHFGRIEYAGLYGGFGCFPKRRYCPTENDFYVASNQITYIGDLEIIIEKVTEKGSEYTFDKNEFYLRSLTAASDSEAARAYLMANYPDLAKRYRFEEKPIRIGESATASEYFHKKKIKQLGIAE